MFTRISITLFCVMALVTIGFLGCDRVTSLLPEDAETPPIAETAEIPVGLVVSLTGRYAEPYGLPMQRGFELARQEINAHSDLNLTFITADDQSTVEGATAAVQHLVDEDVPVMVGIAISTLLKEAFPIAQANGVVGFSSVSSAAGLSSIGDFIFRAALATDILIPGGVNATHEKLGYQKVALIYDSADVFSTSGYEEMSAALQAAGVDILTVETLHTGDTDFSEQLTRIKDLNPDAVFISALSQEMVAVMIQGRQIGIPNSVHFILSELSGDDIQKAGEAAEGTITFSSWSDLSHVPGNQKFIQDYMDAYGMPPELWAAQSYATLHILAAAITHAGSADSVAIRDALAQTADFPTILGNFSFDSNGEAVYEPVVLTVENGELILFE